MLRHALGLSRRAKMSSCCCKAADGHKAGVCLRRSFSSLGLEQEDFGVTQGQRVFQFSLTNGNGMEVVLTNYGATVLSVKTPDRDGKAEELTLQYPTLQEILEKSPFYGSTCGRVANRIANGEFSLEGKSYSLAVNNGPNHLHGGEFGFDKVVWGASTVFEEENGRVGIVFSHESEDGEEGYPGNLSTQLMVSLDSDNCLHFEYEAFTDAPTPVNLTNHTYWNLSGDIKHSVLGHTLQLSCDRYTPVDDTSIPTGEVASVTGTPFDFTQGALLGDRIALVEGGGEFGIDHNLVIDAKVHGVCHGNPALVATVTDPASGRRMEVFTTEPAVQVHKII